ncbi:MAG TPA: membrane dipeptidase [Coriobacteriia bacterium]
MAAQGVRRKQTFIDLHQDMLSGVALLDGGFPVYGSNYLHGAHRAAAVWSALYPHQPESSLMSQLEAHRELLRSHSASLRLITTVEDLDSGDPRTGVLPHSEGLALPEIGPDALNVLWDEHALRSLSLTWNHETAYGSSCFEDSAAPLTPVGRHLLRELENSPLFLDLAHLNDAGFFEALELYAPTTLVTHTFCRAITDHPRGLADDQLRALGDHGGLVGLAFPPDFLGERGSVDEALRHIDRIATLAGEDAVSIGSDWGVATMGELGDPAALAGLVEAVADNYGPDLADKFAFDNAHDFLRDYLPAGQEPLAP